MAGPEVAVALHVADDGLDGGAAPELALNDTKDATLLTGDEDAARAFGCVAAVTLVDIGTLDGTAGELLGRIDDGTEGMAIIWIARERPGVEHELAAPGAAVGGDDRDLDAELVRRRGLAFTDAFDLGRMEGIELPAALPLLLRSDLRSPGERRF